MLIGQKSMRVFKHYRGKNGEVGAESAHGDNVCFHRLDTSDYIIVPFADVQKIDCRYLCEVIRGDRAQRLKLDIDSTVPVDIDTVCAHCNDVFAALWPTAGLPEYTVLTAHGMGKYSYHVIFSTYVADNVQAKMFTSMLVQRLPNYGIDESVNKSLQNFRVLGATKWRQNRPLIPEDNGFGTPTLAGTLIEAYEKVDVLPRIVETVQKEPSVKPPDFCEEAVAKYPFPNHEYSRVESSAAWACCLRLDRKAPDTDICRICGRGPHTSDNTGIIYIAAASQLGSAVYHGCRRGGTPILQGYVGAPAPAGAPSWRLLAAASRQTTPAATGFESLRKLEYSDTTLRDFNTDLGESTTLCVKAATKMGKTKKLAEFVRGFKGQRIVILSFRRAFSANIREKFPDFSLYSDTRGQLFANKLIIQVESLHRLHLGEPVDLLVMDECESIFAQFGANLAQNLGIVWAVFRWLLSTASMVVCMDANLGKRSFDMLSAMRPDFSNGLYHHATCKNAANTTHYATASKEVWSGILWKVLEAGKRVAIPVSSLSEAEAISVEIKKFFPEKKQQIYSSKTQPSELKTHLGNVAQFWLVDVLIYTPTITAGVSFEESHFDYVFGYFVHTSCDAATCHQMMARVREIKSNSTVVYLDPSSDYLPTTPEQVENMMIHSREELMRMDTAGLHFTVENGRLTVEKTDYWRLWVANVCEQNRSRRNLTTEWCKLAHQSGAKVVPIDDAICVEFGSSLEEIFALGAIKLEHQKATKIKIREETATAIACADDIHEEEVKRIQEAKVYCEDVPQQKLYEYERARLRQHYHHAGAISPEFVLAYDNSAAKRAFRNISEFGVELAAANSVYIDGDVIQQAIAGIQLREQARMTMRMEGETSRNCEASATYRFSLHRSFHACLHACGFESICDREHRPAFVCGQGMQTVIACSAQIAPEFGVRPLAAAEARLPIIMSHLSTLLNKFYALKIVTIGGQTYQIQPNDLFEIEKTGRVRLLVS